MHDIAIDSGISTETVHMKQASLLRLSYHRDGASQAGDEKAATEGKKHPGLPGGRGAGLDGRSVSVSKKESVRTVAGGFDKPSHMVSLS